MRKIDVLASMGCRLGGEMWWFEFRRHSAGKGVSRQTLRILTCDGINVRFAFQSMNGVGPIEDLWTDFEPGSGPNHRSGPRNNSLFVKLVELAF